ncbi:MAG TPA: cytochrome d ubiquinol oxidase subunit II, partial [Gemmatimonadales bacterium]|nr:cytochrome d ubiquinol oxidase subunit II [Gemmatimonadales bacterium]
PKRLMAEVIAGLMAGALILYGLLGGADYGGGVWDLLATGPRAREQRRLIADAIAPVWEANHVWLILVLVILFTAFPPAFAAIGTALHIPLTLMLIGVVLRGTAFTFRHYDDQHDQVQRRWSLLFSIASIVTPILLGVSVGAVVSGDIRAPDAGGSFISPWLAPFPFAVGLLALALFAFLAGVFLTVEAKDAALADDFRRRAIWAGIAVFVTAGLTLLLARRGAPMIWDHLLRGRWALPLQLATGMVAIGAFAALWARRYWLARVLAAAQVSLILAGWATAQFPWLVVPEHTISSAAAPDSVLRPLLLALGLGVLVLGPSVYYLMRVFKGVKS